MAKKRVKRSSKRTVTKSVAKIQPNLSNIPTGIKIISIIFYVVGALAIAFGVFFVVAAFMVPSLMGSLGTPEELVQKLTQANPGIQVSVADVNSLLSILPVLFAVAGVVLIILGILDVFIGRGLIGGKQWAKVLAILFVALGIVQSVFSIMRGRIISGIIWLVIFIVIEYYLGFDEKSKKFFR
ncbi:MAG: DUF2127 domain-containing protein [Nanoarchaeota archaeon]